MEPLTSDEDRARVKAIAQGWQQALRARAGVKKVDGVHDLARLMRAPGSLNGKGEKPVPVVLLDNGGPRYTLEQARRPCARRRGRGAAARGLRRGRRGGDPRPSRRPRASSSGGRARPLATSRRACGTGHWAAAPASTATTTTRSPRCCATTAACTPDDKHKGERDDYIDRTVGQGPRTGRGGAPRPHDRSRRRRTLADLLAARARARRALSGAARRDPRARRHGARGGASQSRPDLGVRPRRRHQQGAQAGRGACRHRRCRGRFHEAAGDPGAGARAADRRALDGDGGALRHRRRWRR